MQNIKNVFEENKQVITKRETRSNNYKKKIIESASKVFIEKGYNLASMDEIAKRAGVTKRTLYKHFPSKLAVYAAINAGHLKKLRSEYAKNDQLSLPPDQRFLKDIDTLFQYTWKNQKVMQLWIREIEDFTGEFPAELKKNIQMHTNEIFKRWEAHIKWYHDQGRMINVEPALLVHLLSAVVKGVLAQTSSEKRFAQVSRPGKANVKDLYDLAMVVIQKGLLR